MTIRLALVGFLTSALVGAVYVLTLPAIESAREFARQALLREVSAPLLNDGQFGPSVEIQWHPDAPEALSFNSTVTPILAGQTTIGFILPIRTTEGYSGIIDLLLAIDSNARIVGLRTLTHRETPGLGDSIELSKSEWILDFDGLAFSDLAPRDWTVMKDGGYFDSFTGATITPRAVIDAVAVSLAYLEQKPTEVFDAR